MLHSSVGVRIFVFLRGVALPGSPLFVGGAARKFFRLRLQVSPVSPSSAAQPVYESTSAAYLVLFCSSVLLFFCSGCVAVPGVYICVLVIQISSFVSKVGVFSGAARERIYVSR
jgi:hypothetical protein